jgi:hypothetical protein
VRCWTSLGARKAFTPAELDRLRRTVEARIEPAAQDRKPPVKPIIWVVTDDSGVYVRSFYGARGRWYQQIRKDPRAILYVGRSRIPVRARTVSGPLVKKSVDDAYRRKYGKRWPSETADMLKQKARRHTLRLTPA